MTEDRTERRRDYDVKIDVLTERVENWMESTDEYRRSLCAKLNVIQDKLNKLPCGVSGEERKALRADISWLQRGAVAIISVLFLMGFAWGTLSNKLENGKDQQLKLEEEVHRLELLHPYKAEDPR